MSIVPSRVRVPFSFATLVRHAAILVTFAFPMPSAILPIKIQKQAGII